jgi:hypothetical protein
VCWWLQTYIRWCRDRQQARGSSRVRGPSLVERSINLTI